jgi:hypothetical protein
MKPINQKKSTLGCISPKHKSFPVFLFQFLLAVSLLFSGPVQAQITWDDWGGGSVSTTVSTNPYYVDGVRAHVNPTGLTTTPQSAPGVTWLTGSIPIDNLSGSFSTGDIVMFVQMDKTSDTRNYDLAQIKAGSTSSSLIVEFAMQGHNGITIGQSDLHVVYTSSWIQVIRIDNYYNLTINTGGNVTCHPWDENTKTGGIAAIDVENTLTLSGGSIDVSGKGYPGGSLVAGGLNGTATAGTGGGNTTTQGGNGASATGTGSSVYEYGSRGNILHAAGTSGCTATAHNGGDGGNSTQYNDASSGSAANNGITRGHDPDPSSLLINLGAGGNSGASGRGSSSGGAGGAGGGSYYYYGDGQGTHDPVLGGNGTTAGIGAGGTGGPGGAGGGFIYLRAKNWSGSSTILKVNGADGTGGGDAAGDPGRGGDGGKGGDGYCDGSTQMWAAGGGGVAGKGGYGGDGGDGGQGGMAGGIITIYNTTAPSLTKQLNYGHEGNGGQGLSAAINGSDGADGASVDVSCLPNACTFTYQHKNSQLIIRYCDCEDAFAVLTSMDGCTSAGSTYNFTMSSSSDYSVYNSSSGLESHHFNTASNETYHSGAVTEYEFLCNILNCSSFFPNACTNHDGSYTSLGSGWGTSPSFSHGYYPNGQVSPYKLYQSSSPLTDANLYCKTNCHDDGGSGNGNSSNTPAIAGTYSAYQDDNSGGGGGGSPYISDPLGPVVKKNISHNGSSPLTLNPNPAKDILNLVYYTLTDRQDYHLNIIDIKGQVILNLNFSATTGQNTYSLSTTGLAPGSYTVVLESIGKIEKANFVKQ